MSTRQREGRPQMKGNALNLFYYLLPTDSADKAIFGTKPKNEEQNDEDHGFRF